jgi:hypothetical protein
MKSMLTIFLGAVLLAGPVHAQGNGAAGTWDVNFPTPNGPMSVALNLKKDGEKLSGTIVGPQGDVAVEGTQKDNAVAVNFSVQTPNGAFAIVMSGKQDGDAIAGTMDFGGQGQAEWTGKRRAGAAAPAAGAAATPTAGQADKPADVSGVWAIQIDLGGQPASPTATLKQDGEKLTGTYSSQVLGEQQLTGTVKGNDITFGFQASFDGNAVKVTYTGKVDKDTMKGSVAFGDMGEGTFTAKKK